ncbi:MAG: alpha-amylase family glycosyl hydrolase [Chloroflexota bacterium]|nr:alpha-amylase family glycosyl hydrolase [Chloroflexota bacterium]
MTPETCIQDHMAFLYGEEEAEHLWFQLQKRLSRFRKRNPHLQDTPPPADRLTERDAFLITYGDQVTEPNTPPLRTLAKVLEKHVKGVVTGVHILPFFPYSSDDGFSVIDYTTVNPDWGMWADIERLGCHFRLMFDAVINHISAQSEWFQGFLEGDPRFEDYFITVEPGTDLSQVVRPRARPLLTPVQTLQGEELVWTTFSADQIDLDYANPDVLLDVIDVLLFYVEKGAEVIRLDAVAYLWKKIGTSCIHLDEAHRVVKLLRAIFDIVAPGVILITEANVPHEENVSYFGDGYDEAQMVYQFPLPPLVLHAFHTGDATRLSEWVAALSTPSESTAFFNFLASHDGIGVRPVEGILTPSEIQALVDRTKKHGGYVSYKTDADGNKIVYELNISYFDALSYPEGGQPLYLQVRRFLASQAIMLSLAGVPGIYAHSLFGSRSYHQGVEETGRYRSINREKFRRSELEEALADPSSLRHQVFYPYLDLIRSRAAHRAFHPNGRQRVLLADETGSRALFTLLRASPDGDKKVLCVHNVSNTEQPFHADLKALSIQHQDRLEEVVSGKTYPVGRGGELTLTLDPYQVLWLKATM